MVQKKALFGVKLRKGVSTKHFRIEAGKVFTEYKIITYSIWTNKGA